MENRAQLLRWLSKSTPTEPGYFYLLRFCDGVYKIGRAKDLNARMKDHRRQYRTCDFEIVFTLCTTKWRELENCIRALFRAQIIEGDDWLNLSDEDVSFISSLTPDFVEGKISVPLNQKQDSELIIWLSGLSSIEREAIVSAVRRELYACQTGVRQVSDKEKRAL